MMKAGFALAFAMAVASAGAASAQTLNSPAPSSGGVGTQPSAGASGTSIPRIETPGTTGGMTAPNGAVDGTTIGTVPPAAGPITNRAVTGTVDPAIAGQTGLTTRGSGFTDGRNAAAGETYIRETGSVTGMPRPRVGVDLDKIRNAMEADTGSSPPPSAW